MITLTAEQAQQIEEALVAMCNSLELPEDSVQALATIRAARAQEQAEQEPVAWYGETEHQLAVSLGYKKGWQPLYAAPQPVTKLKDIKMTNTNEQNLDLEYKAQMFDALIQAGVEKLPVFKTALALFNCEEPIEPVKQEPVAFVSEVYQSRYTLEWNGRSLPVGAPLYDHSNSQPVVQAEQEPVLHVGDSSFEDWYQAHPKASGGDKQLARDAYAAGMGDPLVMPVQSTSQEHVTCDSVRIYTNGYNTGYDNGLKAAQQPVQQEPVACIECGRPTMSAESNCDDCHSMDDTAPVHTKDLTDDEIVKTAKWTGVFETKIGYEFGHGDLLDFARAVIAADREKNK